MNADSWYHAFFDEDYLRLYAPVLTEERTAAEVDGIVSLLGLPVGSAILDLCCGHGRHAIPLARRGYLMTGQDLTALFLERAAADARPARAAVRWVQSDMREIPFRDEFDAVINIFTAFGYLESDHEDLNVLRQVHKALTPGGLFLIEVIHRDNVLGRHRAHYIRRHDDGTIEMDEAEFDLLTSRDNVLTTIVSPDGSRRERRRSARLYSAAELRRMLAAAL
jgi:SAM-dependent methyltransferase